MVKNTILSLFFFILLVFLLSLAAFPEAAENNKENFANVPQIAVLKARIYKSVSAKGYVVTTDSKGNVVNTTDATDYEIKNISFDKKTNLAKVVLIPKDFSIVVKQEWRYKEKDWIFNNQDEAINKLRQIK